MLREDLCKQHMVETQQPRHLVSRENTEPVNSTIAYCATSNPSPPFPSQKEDHYPSVPGSVGFHHPPHLHLDGPSQGLPFYVTGDHRGQHWPGPAPHPHMVSSGNIRLIPLHRGEEAASTGREDSSDIRGSVSLISSGYTHMFPPQLNRSHSFPIHILTFTVNILWEWEYNL